MYLIISWFYSLGKISGIVPEPKLKNWKTEFSREIQEEILHMDSVFQFFCFSVLLTELFRNISADISEYLRRNWKTEKLNFPERSRKRFSIWIQFFSFSVFQFCLRNYSGIFPQTFRNICGETEKLKNRKTEKQKNWIFQRDPGRDFPYGFSFSVFLFFSFAYGTIPEYFRRHCGIFAEKLKNWKTEFSREIQEDILHIDSVFQFCLRNYSGIFPETFRNICGETEKLKNWIFQRDPGRHSPYRFSFSVLLTELFRNISADILEDSSQKGVKFWNYLWWLCQKAFAHKSGGKGRKTQNVPHT